MFAIESTVDTLSHSSTSSTWRVRPATIMLVLTLVAVWAVSLSRNLFYPFFIDTAFFQYLAAQEISGHTEGLMAFLKSSPAPIMLHKVAILLFGPSPLGFRIFDLCWQCLTLAAFVTLGMRDGRRWNVGWLAAILYVFLYYGMGYKTTADRDDFTVLLLLLAIHAVISGERSTRYPLIFAWYFVVGALGFAIFAIKLPLGMCFGMLWLWGIVKMLQRDNDRMEVVVALSGLTVGFLALMAFTIGWLFHAGWWRQFWPLLETDLFLPFEAPKVFQDGLPLLLAGSAGMAVVLALAYRFDESGVRRGIAKIARSGMWLRSLAAGTFALCVFLILANSHGFFARVQGLIVIAVGAMLCSTWHGRSLAWKTVLLLGCGGMISAILQGAFGAYHCIPMLACASYVAANEVVERITAFHTSPRAVRAWMVVCLGAVAHMATHHWCQTMTRHVTTAYVLADRTLEEHYALLQADLKRFPSYQTLLSVSDRVRKLTSKSEELAVLFCDARLYYLCDRPAVHPLIHIEQAFSPLFPQFIQTIVQKKPKVLLARAPMSMSETGDQEMIDKAVFDGIIEYFGPTAESLHGLYRVTEVIDDICILQRSKNTDIRLSKRSL